MTDDMRRLLTEYIGECWHEPKPMQEPQYWVGGNGTHCLVCKNCGQNYGWNYNHRPFTTPADLHAVYGRMVEVGKWAQFLAFAINEFQSEKGIGPGEWAAWVPETLAWLFCLSDPSQIGERMEMAAGYLKETS